MIYINGQTLSRPATTLNGLLVVGILLATTSSAIGQQLTAKLSKHVAVTGETLELEEAMSLEVGMGVTTISHRVWRTGIYHRALQQFVLLHLPSSQQVFPTSLAFDSLSDSRAAPHGIPLEEFENGLLAKTFAFRVRDPGVYVITVEWRIKARGDMGERLPSASNPVILFVKPSRDYDQVAKARAPSEPSGRLLGLNLQETMESYYDEHHNLPGFDGIVIPVSE